MKALNESICPLCGGEKVKATTTYTVNLQSGLLVVRSVPVMRCAQCSEEWIDNETAKRLEELANDTQKRKCELAVVAL